MKGLAIFCMVAFLVHIIMDMYNNRTPNASVENMENLIDITKSHKTWEYYVAQGISWAIDILIVIVLVAACFAL